MTRMLLQRMLKRESGSSGSGDWSAATTSRTFVLDNPNRLRKLYCNWRSGNVSHASAGDTGTPPPSVSGTYSFNTRYRVRLGAAT